LKLRCLKQARMTHLDIWNTSYGQKKGQEFAWPIWTFKTQVMAKRKVRSSHDPFGHLKHKLWPKERPWIKLTVWLPTTKSWELTRFPCVQVGCNISLESSWWRLQLCVIPHLNQKFTHNIIGPQSCGNPNFGNFGTPIWESRDKMSFGCGPREEAQNIL